MADNRLGLELTLPTALTIGNLLCGFVAVASALGVGQLGAPREACFWLLGAMAFDALDGAAARWLGSDNRFGAQLDALADMVSFGVAPGVLCVQVFSLGKLGVALGLLYVSCAALRLARFVTESAAPAAPRAFSGLPTPAAAACVTALALARATGVWPMLIVALLCGLMLSRRPFLHPASLGGRRLGVLLGAALGVSLFSPAVAVGAVVGAYLLWSLLASGKRR